MDIPVHVILGRSLHNPLSSFNMNVLQGKVPGRLVPLNVSLMLVETYLVG